MLLKIRTGFNHFTKNINPGNTLQIPDSQSNLDTHVQITSLKFIVPLLCTLKMYLVYIKNVHSCVFIFQALYAARFLAFTCRRISALSTQCGSVLNPDLD